MDKLKLCPFCGGTPFITRDDIWHYATCPDCGATSQEDLGDSGAIENWNTRPIEDDLLAACKAFIFDYDNKNMLGTLTKHANEIRAAIATAEGADNA